MKLLEEINEITQEIQAIVENFGFSSLEELLSERYGERYGPVDTEGQGKARAGEQEWLRGLTKDKYSRAGEGPGMHRPGRSDPQSEDIIQYQGKLYRLGELNPQTGEYSTVSLRDRRPGMPMLAQYIRKHFYGKVGADGRTLWIPRGK